MKKLFAILLALVMVLSLNVSVFAAEDSFISSPSNNRAPVVEDCKNENSDCTSDVVVIPFGDRDKLPDDVKQELQDAYDSILKTDDLTDLFSGIESILTPGTSAGDLSVSDIFNVGHTDCPDHANHGRFEITLSTDTTKGFVGLVQFIDGKWVIVEDAKVENGKLTFSSDADGTYAIVVDKTKAETTSPVTGAPVASYAAGITVFAVLCGAMVVLAVTKKKA